VSSHRNQSPPPPPSSIPTISHNTAPIDSDLDDEPTAAGKRKTRAPVNYTSKKPKRDAEYYEPLISSESSDSDVEEHGKRKKKSAPTAPPTKKTKLAPPIPTHTTRPTRPFRKPTARAAEAAENDEADARKKAANKQKQEEAKATSRAKARDHHTIVNLDLESVHTKLQEYMAQLKAAQGKLFAPLPYFLRLTVIVDENAELRLAYNDMRKNIPVTKPAPVQANRPSADDSVPRVKFPLNGLCGHLGLSEERAQYKAIVV
jgi:hypothetical protein